MDDIKTWAEMRARIMVNDWNYDQNPQDPEKAIVVGLKEAYAKGQESEKQRIKGICDKIQNELSGVGSEDAYSIGHLWALEKIKDALDK